MSRRPLAASADAAEATGKGTAADPTVARRAHSGFGHALHRARRCDGTLGAMSSAPSELTSEPGVDLLPLPDVAERLGLPVNRVHQLLRDGMLVALRPDGAPPAVPVTFLGEDAPVKGLPGVITLLRDARYSDEEIVQWLHRPDDSLPGRPIDALRANRGTEIKRRAQAAGF